MCLVLCAQKLHLSSYYDQLRPCVGCLRHTGVNYSIATANITTQVKPIKAVFREVCRQQQRFSLFCPPASHQRTSPSDTFHIAVSGTMGACCSIPTPATDAAPEAPSLEHLEPISAVQNGHASLQTMDQQTKCQPDALLPEHYPQDSITQWRQEHQLQQQILLQSQEIAKLREQVIDLQAYRQQQQKQHQRAAYMKSQMLSAGSSHKLPIPEDCCAAAMACCIAVEELKADLKVEGQMISMRLDTLSH